MRRSVISACALALATAAVAAPSALAAPRLVANVAPWVPQVSPSGSIRTLRLDCAATDPNAVHIDIHCYTDNGADETASADGPAATLDRVAFVGGGVGVSFTSFTFCAQATFRYADGSTSSTELGCTPDDFGTGTVIG